MLLFPWRTYYHCLQGDCCYSLAMGKGEYYYFFKGGSTTIPLEGVLLCPCIGKSRISCKGSITIYANHGECYYPILRNITTDSKGNTAIPLQWEKVNITIHSEAMYYLLWGNTTTPFKRILLPPLSVIKRIVRYLPRDYHSLWGSSTVPLNGECYSSSKGNTTMPINGRRPCLF